MKKHLSNLEGELLDAKHLVMTLDNAINYCMESGIDAHHLYLLSGYISEKMEKIYEHFDDFYCECVGKNFDI